MKLEAILELNRPSHFAHRSLGATLAAASLLCSVSASRGALISVPTEHETIQAAIAAASSGDTIRVDGSAGPYSDGMTVNAALVSALTIEALDPLVPADIIAVPEQWVMLSVLNDVNAVLDLTLRNLSFDGAGELPGYGIRLFNAPYEGEEPLTRLVMEGVSISRVNFGLQLGTKTGTTGCDGKWGAVDWESLDQSHSIIEMRGCSFVETGQDAVRLYNTSGVVESSLFSHNGDEAIHTTHASDLVIRHNVFARNATTALHFQLPGSVEVSNNIITTTRPRSTTSPTIPGFGLTVGGAIEGDSVRVHNNLLLANDGAGVKVNPVEVFYPDSTCISFPFHVDVRNNTFVGNADCSLGCKRDVELLVNLHETPGSMINVRYNRFRDEDSAGELVLDETNLLGIDPYFTAPLESSAIPDTILNPMEALGRSFSIAAGYSLADSSEAVDAGDPDLQYEDGGGLALGGPRNDIGPYGGPGSVWPIP